MAKFTIDKNESILFLIILIIAVLGLCYEITVPWDGWFDFNGAVYSRFAKNFLTFGFLKTKMSPVWNIGAIIPEQFNYYLHHPPLLPYLVAASFKIFGIHEWSARIIPIIFSVMALAVYYFIIRLTWGKAFALLSSFFLGLAPMFLYYGRMVNQEPVFLFFYFLTAYFYLKFLSEKKDKHLILTGVSLFFAFLTAWQAFYLALIILIHYVLCEYKNIRDRRLLIVFSLAPTLFAFFYITWIIFIKGALNDNLYAMISRFGPNERHQFNWPEFLLLEADRIKFLFTKILCILSSFFVILFYLEKDRKVSRKESVSIIFFSLAAVNIFLFREGAFEHEYQLYYFLPFFGIIGARAIFLLKTHLHNQKLYKIFVLCFMILFLKESYHNLISLHAFKFDIDREVACKINSLTYPDEEIGTNFLISVPTSWYVDRKYTVINSRLEFEENCMVKKLALMAVIPSSSNTDFVEYLSENYPSIKYRNVILYGIGKYRPLTLSSPLQGKD